MIERVFTASHETSPIEEYLAYLMQEYGLDRRWGVSSQVPIWSEVRRDWPQYILDFSVTHTTASGRTVRINVELDGEEFHTDTAYDATRDEYMRQLGFVVVRFSGTEVYRAGREIVAYLDVLLWALVNQGRGAPAWIAAKLIKPTVRQKPDGMFESYLPIAGTRF